MVWNFIKLRMQHVPTVFKNFVTIFPYHFCYFSASSLENYNLKVSEHIQKAAGSTLFSFEVLPPQKGKNMDDLLKVIEPLMDFNPPFIDVTYHPEETLYRKQEDGTIIEIPLRKRPGTVGICAAIKGKYNVDTVPHLVCEGFTKEETEDALFTLHYLGIHNLLLLKGDSPKNKLKVNDKRSHNYAYELVEQVSGMNKGQFLYEETEIENRLKTDFCIGVAGYPEKHFEAPNMVRDLQNLKRKVDAGADYVVTQMFFNNKKYFDFVEKCRQKGINTPIIPGIKPIESRRQLKTLPTSFLQERTSGKTLIWQGFARE